MAYIGKKNTVNFKLCLTSISWPNQQHIRHWTFQFHRIYNHPATVICNFTSPFKYLQEIGHHTCLYHRSFQHLYYTSRDWTLETSININRTWLSSNILFVFKEKESMIFLQCFQILPPKMFPWTVFAFLAGAFSMSLRFYVSIWSRRPPLQKSQVVWELRIHAQEL